MFRRNLRLHLQGRPPEYNPEFHRLGKPHPTWLMVFFSVQGFHQVWTQDLLDGKAGPLTEKSGWSKFSVGCLTKLDVKVQPVAVCQPPHVTCAWPSPSRRRARGHARFTAKTKHPCHVVSTWQVLGSNLGQQTGYPDRFYVGFLSSYRQIPGQSSVRRHSSPSTPFKNHYLLTVILWDFRFSRRRAWRWPLSGI
jgi:hypothetical protein